MTNIRSLLVFITLTYEDSEVGLSVVLYVRVLVFQIWPQERIAQDRGMDEARGT